MQVVIAFVGALLVFFLFGKEAAKSAFFGGIVAVANGLFFLRKIQAASKMAATLPTRAVGMVYSGVVVRFVLVLILFAVGFGVLHLLAPPALFIFALAQLAYGWVFRKSYKEL